MGYRTVKGYGEEEFTEKKSRFIGYVTRVSQAEDAMAFVEQISKKHRDARHNVFCYSLKNGQKRASDNGEPQGTAGAPILEYLEKSGITDVVCVVTRYFGGILLGTGGLSRAYSLAAKLACEQAGVVTMAACVEFCVSCDYALYGKLSYILPEYGAATLSSDFGSEILLFLRIEKERYQSFADKVTELSGGSAKIYAQKDVFAEL